jgi:hypothetical protein
MARLIQNRFSSWELDETEKQQAAMFTDLQTKHIQNIICEAATEKSSLTFDPQNPLQFTQKEAELQGQIGILEYLLAMSTEAYNQATSNLEN